MISFEEAIEIHSILIDQFGGSRGLRDSELLKSALSRPYQTFDGKELYESPVKKAATIMESIIKNHPFVDGNKRTGYVLARLILMDAKLDIKADEDSKYNFVISISKNKIDIEQIVSWLERNSR